MLFSSSIFIFYFLPFVIGVHFILCRHDNKYANIFLSIMSLFFYAWGNPMHLSVLIFSVMLNYSIGLTIEKTNPVYKKLLLIAGVTTNLLILIYFKYMGLLFDFSLTLGMESISEWSFLKNIVLPLGISFFTFQGLSYLIDIYRGEVKAVHSLTDIFCYLTMFPQLVAGPIVRYSEVMDDIHTRKITADNFSKGAQRFIIGLAKKCLLADTFATVADAAFAMPNHSLHGTAAWLGILCYTLQIYYDFSGYSDMAIGMGLMMGFTFPENFNYPYISQSIREYWRRWHMTLSRWLRDYLYIPLGGSRGSKIRTYINLFIVFAICGLWHGATVSFLIWGLFYGLFLTLERMFPNFFDALPRFAKHIYVLLVVIAGWVIFRADTLTDAFYYFQAMLFLNDSQMVYNAYVWLKAHGYALYIYLVIAILFALPIHDRIKNYFHKEVSLTSPTLYKACSMGYLLSLLLLFVFTLMSVVSVSYRSFIYFRF